MRRENVTPEFSSGTRSSWRGVGALITSLRDEPLYRNSIFLVLNTVILTSTGILFWLVAARLVGTAELGIATSLVAALTAISMIARLGIDVLFLRYLHDSGAGARALLDTGITLCCAAAMIAAVVFAVGAPIWAPDLDFVAQSPLAVTAFALTSVVFALAPLMDSIFTARGRASFTFFKNALYSVGRIGLLAIVLVVGPIGIVSSLVVAMAGSILIGLVWLRRVEPGYRPRAWVGREVLRSMLRPALPSYAVSLVLVLPLSLGSLIVLNRFGSAEAALFYILWTFGSLSMLVPNAFGQASLVEMVRKRDLGVSRGGRPILVTALAAAGVLVAGLTLLPLFGPEYAALGFVSLVPFALAAVPGFWFQVKIAQLRTTEQNGALLTVVGATVGSFLIAMTFLPIGVAQTGWCWVVALALGLGAAHFVRIAPQEGYS